MSVLGQLVFIWFYFKKWNERKWKKTDNRRNKSFQRNQKIKIKEIKKVRNKTKVKKLWKQKNRNKTKIKLIIKWNWKKYMAAIRVFSAT